MDDLNVPDEVYDHPLRRTVAAGIETIAAATHMVNRAYCIGIGDLSQPTWQDAPDWQKQSAYDGVMAVLRGDVDTAEQSHERWRSRKIEEGWVYGKVKDPFRKTHPCLVPYQDLPPGQRTKDHLFLDTIRTLRTAM
jgi:hypothetical protein